jgi:hydrogenase-4 component B
LPPLNGFVGEWMIYLGLFRTMAAGAPPAAAPVAAGAVVLAMIGALAVACFVKLVGMVFLGSPRSHHGAGAGDPSAWMLAPMATLACGCVLLGLFPGLAAAPIENAVRSWAGPSATGAPPLAALAPLGRLCAFGLGLLGSVAVTAAAATWVPRRCVTRAALTWDCGYARPTARMQYTGSSLGQSLVIQLRMLLWPKSHRGSIQGPFPAAASFKSVVPDPVLDRALVPLFRQAGRTLPLVRVFQQGQTQAYVLYVLLILIVLLMWGPIGVQP